METPVEILKPALIARINDLRVRAARRRVVDTRYDIINGSAKLILVFEDGGEKVFKGLKAA